MALEIRYLEGNNLPEVVYTLIEHDADAVTRLAQHWVNNNQYSYSAMSGFRIYEDDVVLFEVDKDPVTKTYPPATFVELRYPQPSIRPRSIIEI